MLTKREIQSYTYFIIPADSWTVKTFRFNFYIIPFQLIWYYNVHMQLAHLNLQLLIHRFAPPFQLYFIFNFLDFKPRGCVWWFAVLAITSYRSDFFMAFLWIEHCGRFRSSWTFMVIVFFQHSSWCSMRWGILRHFFYRLMATWLCTINCCFVFVNLFSFVLFSLKVIVT